MLLTRWRLKASASEIEDVVLLCRFRGWTVEVVHVHIRDMALGDGDLGLGRVKLRGAGVLRSFESNEAGPEGPDQGAEDAVEEGEVGAVGNLN
jgi:hypothetical protein